MNHAVRTTCPYCGVGCGVLASSVNDAVEIRGDHNHPANFGRLCSKGAALGETLGLSERLLYPEIRGQRCDWNTALDTVAQNFARTIREHGADSVAFYVSGQLTTEDYYVANKLMKGFLGSANIDTNSRLCMASSVAGHQRAFGADTVPGNYQDLELASLIVLVGSNTAWCHPVIYQRIQQAKTANPDLKIVVIDPRRTATCEGADLHLSLKPGSDSLLFNGLLVYLYDNGDSNPYFVNTHTQDLEAALNAARASAPTLDAVANGCGLDKKELTQFYRWFSRNEKTVSAYSQGVNQSSSGTDKVNAIINCHLLTGRIGRPGMGPFSITGQPNAMGGREVGGLANQLAVHMNFDPANVDRVQRFWDAPNIARGPGLKAVDMFRAVDEGRIKALWIIATNPVVSMPDADRVRAALARCEFVVVSDCARNTDTMTWAQILLPALAWGEKNGTVTNSERRISRQRAFLAAPGEAKPDWWMLSEVAKRLGYEQHFNYQSAADIFREYAALSGFENEGQRDFDISAFGSLSSERYDTFEPIQWPVTHARPQGTARFFADGRFYTDNRKARFVAITPRAPVNATDVEYPLILNTGRTRDHWHTLTRTGLSPRLSAHAPEPYAEIHPQDAAQHQIQNGTLVSLSTRWGKMLARAQITPAQQRGSVFAPIHWNDQFALQARVDALANPVTDPISGQPEFKHTPVKLMPYAPAWQAFLLTRRRLNIPELSYCARAIGKDYWRYELAGDASPKDWPSWARTLLCTPVENNLRAEWIEYLDAGIGHYRGARILGGRLDSCVFVAPTSDLPARDWLASLFARETLSDAERTHLLAGTLPSQKSNADGGIVCACFGIGKDTILNAIRENKLDTVAAVGEKLKAGTNCGSCIPEIKGLLNRT
ncbi:MAG: molybdopterin-dependent oxidoreductase [Gammaproteobacteria bacterium]|nr:molybdopterin-dependent oxidoreductase [Gammaproteobacteria bacterium]